MGRGAALAAQGQLTGPLLHVRGGEVADRGEWIYAWLLAGEPAPVVHLGATALDPATRTWLHLNDPDPGVGRIAARLADWREREFAVVFHPLPEGVDRAEARQAGIAAARERGLLSARYVGFEPTDGPFAVAATAEGEALCEAIEGYAASAASSGV